MISVKAHPEFFVILVHFVEFRSFKKRFSAEEDMKNSPKRKYVTSRLDVLRLSEVDDLWGHVPWCPASEK
jgi:hypothetical protein